jgi:hypothetical protein
MQHHLITQLSGIIEDAVRHNPMTWAGAPLPSAAVADPLGCLPAIAAATCHICAELNIDPPHLKFRVDEDASFGYALSGLELGEHGFGAFLLTLRDTILNCDREMELLLPALGSYLDRHPAELDATLALHEPR